MKNLNKKYSIIAWAIAGIAFGGCSSNSKNSRTTTQAAAESAPPKTEDTVPTSFEVTVTGGQETVAVDPSKTGSALNLISADAGIKSFNEVRETMGVLTGVSSKGTAIRAQYELIKVQLPGSNDIKTFTGANQTAIFKLSVIYCDLMVDSATLRVKAFPNLDFTQPPATAYANKEAVIKGLTDAFWGIDLVQGGNEAAKKVLFDLLGELAAVPLTDIPAPAGDTRRVNRTLNIAKGICSAALSSAQAMMN